MVYGLWSMVYGCYKGDFAAQVIMLDTIRRCFLGGARPIDKTMLIVEIPLLIFVCYEACVLFVDRRRDKRRIRRKGLENLPSAVLNAFRQLILGGSGPS